LSLAGGSLRAHPGVDNLTRLALNSQNFAHVIDIEITGDLAVAAVGVNPGTELYDFSDPYNPTMVGRMGEPAWRTRVFGDLLFSFNRRAGLEIYRLEGPPWNLTPLADVPTGGEFHGFECGDLLDDVLYVAGHQIGIFRFDVSDPANPVSLPTIPLAANDCWGVQATQSHLFVANGRQGLSVIELGPDPVELATLPLPGLANDIILDGNVVFLALGGDGIAAVDVSDPGNPQLLDIAPTMGNAFSLGLLDDRLVVGAWRYLELYDVSDPADLRLAGWDHTRTYAVGADITAQGDKDLVVVADWRGIAVYEAAPDAAPDIDVVPARHDFGVVTGSPAVFEVQVLNNGQAPLEVTRVAPPNGVTAEPDVFTVPPGGVQIVTLTAEPDIRVRGAVQFASNDPDEHYWNQLLYANNTNFPQVGSPAPDFTLQDMEGVSHSLSDYLGQVVVLQFGASW
jgi:hypothetical protein